MSELRTRCRAARGTSAQRRRRVDELFQLMDNDLLGVEEQEELVQVLHEQCTVQSRLWQRLFGFLAIVGGLFFFCAALLQAFDPWGTKYTAEFRMSWSPYTVALALMGNGVSCLAAGVGLLRVTMPLGQARTGYSKSVAARVLLVSLMLAQICFVFWAMALWFEYYTLKQRARIPPSFKWSLAWLPASPLAVCFVCKCVADMNAEMHHSVTELRSKMYNYKKL